MDIWYPRTKQTPFYPFSRQKRLYLFLYILTAEKQLLSEMIVTTNVKVPSSINFKAIIKKLHILRVIEIDSIITEHCISFHV